MIDVNKVTMLYPSKKGIKDISFQVKENEIFGYLGPNGAGKTTTIRCLLGFMKAQDGQALVNGLDPFNQHELVLKDVGYLPGEIAFFEEMTGIEFLSFLLELRNIKDKTRMNQLCELFEFDPKGPIKKMSKGNKQKLGLISAFMHDPKIYILDEPTSGLDPLMQQVFVQLVKQEKAKGKTMLMSSHSFEEVEKTCDRVAMIKDGAIAVIEDIADLRKKRRKGYSILLKDPAQVVHLQNDTCQIVNQSNGRVDVIVEGEFNKFFETLKKVDVIDLDVIEQRLEQVFMQYYGNHKEQEK